MPNDRTEGRRADRRAFRPTLDGRLEPRLLLSHVGQAQQSAARMGPVKLFTANGGQSIRLITGNLDRFELALTGPGTIRGVPQGRGRVGFVVDGSTDLTQLTISPLAVSQQRGLAHDFPLAPRQRTALLNVASIEVSSGRIGSILGYHTAKLTGPVTVGGTGSVDRIAFQSLEPGAAIQVGGDLETLDVLTNATLADGPGISVGRDFDAFNVGQNLMIRDGANITVGRAPGPNAQPAKGTGPAGQGITVQGNLIIAPGSAIRIGRDLVGNILVVGNADIGTGSGTPRITVGRNVIGERHRTRSVALLIGVSDCAGRGRLSMGPRPAGRPRRGRDDSGSPPTSDRLGPASPSLLAPWLASAPWPVRPLSSL